MLGSTTDGILEQTVKTQAFEAGDYQICLPVDGRLSEDFWMPKEPVPGRQASFWNPTLGLINDLQDHQATFPAAALS